MGRDQPLDRVHLQLQDPQGGSQDRQDAGIVRYAWMRQGELAESAAESLAAKVVETKPGAPPAAPPKRETQGTGAHGIEYKNGKLYIAVPPAQKIYTVRASDFHVESEFATAGDRPHGLGWEGAHLWCADSNQNAFHKHELPGGRVLAKIQLTDSDPLPHGMAIRKGWMWYCDDVGVVCKLKM